MDVQEIVTEYSDLWTEGDAAARLARLRTTVAEDVEYCDPGADVVGVEALNEVIGGYRATFPGARLVQASELDLHHNVLRFGWVFVDPDDNVLAEGIDVCHLADDNRIKRFTVFFGDVTPLS